MGDGDRLVGMLTDRDIAIRAVALGKGPQTRVQDVMSKEVMYCFADQDLDDAVQNMADLKVRRMPVLNREKRMVGILSLGDVALVDDPDVTGDALCEISEPGGAHRAFQVQLAPYPLVAGHQRISRELGGLL